MSSSNWASHSSRLPGLPLTLAPARRSSTMLVLGTLPCASWCQKPTPLPLGVLHRCREFPVPLCSCPGLWQNIGPSLFTTPLTSMANHSPLPGVTGGNQVRCSSITTQRFTVISRNRVSKAYYKTQLVSVPRLLVPSLPSIQGTQCLGI